MTTSTRKGAQRLCRGTICLNKLIAGAEFRLNKHSAERDCPAAEPLGSLNYRRRRGGFTIVEAAMATLIVGLVLSVALVAVGASRASRTRMADRVRGEQLALDLMAEILQTAYQDPVQATPAFGLEPGESATSRAAWNDVDDYNGWTESPPTTKAGNVIPDFTGWTRRVVVEWIDPTTLAPTSTANTGIKRITVAVQRGGVTMAKVAAYRTSGWTDVIPTPSDATANHPPIAAATGSPLTASGHITTNFDGTASSDQDADALSYVWSFGDGTSATGAQVSHTYNAVGTYNATLTVYDGRGGVGVSTVTVTVN
jgi:type II secretory pathway pseudopilin PulG